jgi:hypothetical protein
MTRGFRITRTSGRRACRARSRRGENRQPTHGLGANAMTGGGGHAYVPDMNTLWPARTPELDWAAARGWRRLRERRNDVGR